MVTNAWYSASLTIGNPHCVELLSDLVEKTKTIMARGRMEVSRLERHIRAVDYLIPNLERQGLLEQRKWVTIAVKELRDVAKNDLEKLRKVVAGQAGRHVINPLILAMILQVPYKRSTRLIFPQTAHRWRAAHRTPQRSSGTYKHGRRKEIQSIVGLALKSSVFGSIPLVNIIGLLSQQR
ncbi:hypothetical protein DFJ58DRAFT_54209 [Suillus subalutaceus]|uniref:uncharacterized protein n=1 Tax=Suillus subalutaceus TaxID=48586 RepID=UPI001B85C4D8|nr:uncharacterized protein DFJ58DRAFT_54209 [Suillus subalutaceus]KAG1842488.1 hypothetical protein DFJ58DRAFT_54209 [Suillus subalutaceus]